MPDPVLAGVPVFSWKQLKGAGVSVLSGLGVLLVLYLARLHSYLLFHSFAEVFSIIVAGGIFMVAWNARHFIERSYFTTLGVAFAFVAFIDLLHTLAYRGMGVFGSASSNLSIQLWVAARLVQTMAFLGAPFFLHRRVDLVIPFLVFGTVSVLLLAGIFVWDVFPDCFVEGTGLTPFKIGAEYVISCGLLAALVLHLRERNAFDPLVLGLIAASLVVTVASEQAFTHYVNVYGFANLIGHYLKVLAFALIYKAFVQVALNKPYQLLFRDLKRSQDAMRESQARLEIANRELQSSLHQLAEDETAARRIQFLLLPPRHLVCPGCDFQSTIHTSAFLSGDFVDYFPITPQKTGFYIADVSGHGVSSALITVLLKSTMAHLLEEHAQRKSDVILHPDSVLGVLNQYLLQQKSGKYLTMFYAILDAADRRLVYSNAGQFPSPILSDAHGTRFLAQKAMPIGLFPRARYYTTEVRVGPHFHLALFSDGVLESLPQPDIRSKEQFLLKRVSSGEADLDRLEASLGLANVDSPVDDLTLMLLREAA